MDDVPRRWPEHDLRWHAARLRAMGRDRDADLLGDLSPLPRLADAPAQRPEGARGATGSAPPPSRRSGA